MYKVIQEYLEHSASIYADKTAFSDEKRELSFGNLQKRAKEIACFLHGLGLFRRPAAVFLDKGTSCVEAMMGAVYSGNFYTVLDDYMPQARISRIMHVLCPAVILTDGEHREAAEAFADGAQVIDLDEIGREDVDEQVLGQIREEMTADDTLYVLFTSGSTGTPKGVVISHRAVIHYLDWLGDTFPINETTVFANQTPFYFVMSGLDIYMTIKCGAQCHIAPKQIFSFPMMTLNWMKEHRINTVFWVPSALCLIANLGALPELHLDDLGLVMFGGEVVPSKQLNMWRREYPEADFINMYGPTEMTDICAYYWVKRRIDDAESLPIGKAADHMKLFLLDEENHEVQPGQIGELCGTGPSLADGYYREPEKTAQVFVENPLYTPDQPEMNRRMYRTGDLAMVDAAGDLIYMGRKDFQIKHMGNRIELGEIETAVSAEEGVASCCCLYDTEKSRIVLFYTGSREEQELREALKTSLPVYMLPNRVIRLEEMPLNLNGKTDRVKLRDMMQAKPKRA